MMPLPTWQAFTETMFGTEDADPGYIAVQRAHLPMDQKKRICTAWCAYYNLGIAAKASERSGAKFWQHLIDIYPTAKRNTERRHFRGAAGMSALTEWRTNYPRPEAMMDGLLACDPTYKSVRAYTRPIKQMGDYFVWKFCDLYDTLSGVRVAVEGSEHHMPKLPAEGAKLLFPLDTPAEALATITRYAKSKGLTAPPHHNRLFEANEAETICCVYKQMTSGSYVYGLRTAKAVRRLRSEPCATSDELVRSLLYLSPWTEQQLTTIFNDWDNT